MVRYFSGQRVCELLASLGAWPHRRRIFAAVACGALLAGGVGSARAQQTTLPSAPLHSPPVTIRTKTVAAPQSSPQSASQTVIAVVHRIGGWKLRTLLAPSDARLAAPFDESFVRTNIVAGFIMSDGRSVIARLPQAEAQMLNLSTTLRDLKTNAPAEDSGLLLVRPDGEQFNARFIGFDASTGLSLLESDQPLMPTVAVESEVTLPVVGQRVRVIAPVRGQIPNAIPAAAPMPQAAARPEDAPVGEEGIIYMNMSERPGHLREIKRSPSGKAMEVTVELNHVLPEWSGGVALSETGTLVGIIEESGGRATRLLSAESVRGAARRVKARGASVPQPWLGARGDAVNFASLDLLHARGWTREQARTLLREQRGILLTAVAPGTPAARAGLRPGDVIARIGQHDVSGIEGMSSMLKELGGNTLADFTVLRAGSRPLNVPVSLSESLSPMLDTARVELRAAQAELRAKIFAVQRAHEEVRRHRTNLRRIEDDLRRTLAAGEQSAQVEQLQKDLKHAQAQIRLAQEQAQKDQSDYQLWRSRVAEAEARYRAASEAYHGLAVKPLLSFGMEAVAVAPAATKSFGPTGSGLLVMSVQAGSAAAQSKIQAGDFIESINDQSFANAGWNFTFSIDFDADLTLGIIRAGQKLTLKLSPQHAPD